MKFMILRKADQDTEQGVMPSEELLAAMANYNNELLEAGALVGGDGLQPSSRGARIKFSGGKPFVTDGPFVETKELLAGYTVIQAKSKEEAIAWATRWPKEDANGEVELELRQMFELEDFAPSEALSQHAQMAEKLARQPAGVSPYLFFDGNCREAMEFYAECLGGTVDMMLNHGESPIADEVPPEAHSRILHASIRLGKWQLMASDAPPEYFEKPQGFSVQIHILDPDRAEQAFNRLAEGGTVRMPFEQTFWALRFGMLVDRFGIPWMINCGEPECPLDA